jgi:hypothetical protein
MLPVSAPNGGIRLVCSRLTPKRTSLITVCENMCVWLAANPWTRTFSSPSLNSPPSPSPSNGDGRTL